MSQIGLFLKENFMMNQYATVYHETNIFLNEILNLKQTFQLIKKEVKTN